MKKKVLLIFFIIILFVISSTVYLNNVFLPQKIKSLIIDNLTQLTQKRVILGSLQFSIFKGLVLRNLSLYEAEKPIVNIQEASCTFLILPLLQKKLIIPKVKVKNAVISLVRKSDNTLNTPVAPMPITAPKKEVTVLPAPQAARPTEKKFSVIINNIIVRTSRIDFEDDTLTPVFTKSIENLNLNLKLSLPANLSFSLKSEIKANPQINITAAGEYNVAAQQLAAKISLQNFSPKEFLAYFKKAGLDDSGGIISALIDLKSKGGTYYADVQAQNKGLVISKEKLQILLNSDIKATFEYAPGDKQLKFSGNSTISDAKLTGLGTISEVNNINGSLAFSNLGVWSDKLNADVWGVPVLAQFRLQDFTNPALDINIASTLGLDYMQAILKDKFKFAFPASLKGNASLALNIIGKTPLEENLQISGYLDIINANIKPDKIPSSIENIQGRVEFSSDKVKWEGLNFKYSNTSYKTSGSLIDFKSPNVELALNSNDLTLNSNFTVNKNIFTFAKLKGKYSNSEFSISGSVDISAPARLETDLNGQVYLQAQDLKSLFVRFKNQLKEANLQGQVSAQFNLKGNINDFKSCMLQAKISSPKFSAYGLKAESLLIDYNQVNDIADISLMRLSLYDGTADVAAKMNLSSQNIPYWVTLDMRDVRLEKLKMDTQAKQKDIAGILSSQVKINGFSNDLSRLSGTGKIFISEGKLWQLNLFKGLGSLIFAKDFANIVFSEGSCDILIKERFISSDNIILKSNIADMGGSARIGFDSSLDASLNVKILDEMAPLSGSFKDLTTAIMGQAGRFGMIKISGTLKEPKYKFKPAVVDIIKGLKNIILGE